MVANKGKAKRVSDEWEGLMNSTSESVDIHGDYKGKSGTLPSFDTIKAMFVDDDEPPVKRKKSGTNKVEV